MGRWWVAPMLFGLLAGTPTPGSSEDERSPSVTAMVAVPSPPLQSPGLRDETAMILVGTALIGLAAALRRTAQ